jgi:hypothetical protein
VVSNDAGTAKKILDKVKHGAAGVMDKASKALKGDSGVKDPPADTHTKDDQRKLRDLIKKQSEKQDKTD